MSAYIISNLDVHDEAKLAVMGEFWKTGEKIARERKRTDDVAVNTSYYGHQKEK